MGSLAILVAAALAGGQTLKWHGREFLPGVAATDEAVESAYWDESPHEKWVYTAGYVTNSSGGTAIAVFKYAADFPGGGEQPPVAQAFFPDPPASAVGINKATGIDVDTYGNVYVCGEVRNAGGHQDYIVAKFNFNLEPSGSWPATMTEPEGIRFYDGPPHGDDRAVDVGVLNPGGTPATVRCIVTGTSYGGSGTLNDIVTLRIDGDGTRSVEWPAAGEGPGVRRFDFLNGNDSATELSLRLLTQDAPAGAIDVAPIVAGTVWAGTVRRFDTLAFHLGPTFGELLWASPYNGPANGDDVCTGLAPFHKGGHTYVVLGGYTPHSDPPAQTMRSGGGQSNSQQSTPVPDTDYLAVTYFAGTGAPYWSDAGWGAGARVWSGPGGSGVSDDFALDVDAWSFQPPGLPEISYAWLTGMAKVNLQQQLGTIAWDLTVQNHPITPHAVSLYGSPSHDDCGMGIQIDGNGAVWVTGGIGAAPGGPNFTEWITLRYDLTGQVVWAQAFTGYGIMGNARNLWADWRNPILNPRVHVVGKSGALDSALDNLVITYGP